MEIILQLSKENLSLAIDEAIALTKKNNGLYDNLLLTSYIKNMEKRIGFSHNLYEFLFSCELTDLDYNIDLFNWQEKYSANFCVRTHGIDEKETAKKIFRKLKNPAVKLRNSESEFHFFLVNETVICGKFLYEIDKTHLKRKAHLRPSLHPTSMNPALAKACINLTGLKKGRLLDPFCGSGGILIEAALMGFSVIGYDIDAMQITRAGKNLRYYHTKAKLLTLDALTSKTKADAIVTDIPYGKSSKSGDVSTLANKFLAHAKNLTDNMVIIYPDFIKPDFYGWEIEKEYSVYIHKSLTRKIAKLHSAH